MTAAPVADAPVAEPVPLRARVLRPLWFALAWVALGRVGPVDLAVGLVASLGAAEASLRLIPPARRRHDPRAIVRFLVHFVRRSAAAGFDVARRVFNPRLPLAPGLLVVETGLAEGLRSQAFAAVASLQPGTLPVGEEDGALLLHVLDRDGPVVDELDADLAVFLDAVGEAGPADAVGEGTP